MAIRARSEKVWERRADPVKTAHRKDTADMTTASIPTAKPAQVAHLASKIISVRELLADSALAIPQYQRPYKWTGKNINQLFSDIAIHKDKSSYRLGTIVFHQHGDRKNI